MRNLWARGGDGEVTLYWTDPSSRDFHHVEIYYSDSYSDVQSAAPSCKQERTEDQSERYKRIDRLTNGTPYYFAVTPMNGQGEALGQALIISATPHGEDPDRPDAVENLVSDPGSGYISLSWSLPKSHADAEPLSPKRVTKVEVSIVPREGTAEAASNLKGAYLAGLQNGKPYSLYIRTVNADGKKSYSVSAVLIPSGVGSGPQDPSGGLDDRAVKNLQAKAGSGQVTLFWEDPVTPCDGLRIYYALDEGGNAYQALVNKIKSDWEGEEEGRAAVPLAVPPYETAAKGQGTTGKVITGLDKNNKVYFFAVTPERTGTVINSPVIVSATLLPDDPNRAADVENLRSTPGNGQVLLTWTLPAIPGIRPEDIEAKIELDKTHSATEIHYLGPDSAYIDGLINGTLYNITVKIKYADKSESAGLSTVAIPQEDSGGGGEEDETSLVLQNTKTNIRVTGGILNILNIPGSKRTFIPVVVYFTDGTWYDGHFRYDGEVYINYPAERVRRIFASLYLVAEDENKQEGKMIYLGRTCNITSPDTDLIRLNIDAKGDLQFRAKVKDNGGDYIPIETTGELALINRDAVTRGGMYKQRRDLNLLGMQQGMEPYRALNWEPLGRGREPFTGVYDGGGFKIDYLYISGMYLQGGGLFGTTEGATLADITVNSGSVQGKTWIGALCGFNGGVISGCFVGQNVRVESEGVMGGLAGENGRGSMIKNSSNYAVITGGSETCGITGRNNGRIKECTNAASVLSPETQIGGIAGINGGVIVKIPAA